MWDLNSPVRDQTHNPWLGRWNFNHWTTREVPGEFALKLVFWKWGRMRFLLQIPLGMQVNECCENPNKYQFKRGFILFPCEVYLSGRSKATKDQASWWKVEPQWVSEKTEGSLTFQVKIHEVAQRQLPSVRESKKPLIPHALGLANHSLKFLHIHLTNGKNDHIPAHLRIFRCVFCKT